MKLLDDIFGTARGQTALQRLHPETTDRQHVFLSNPLNLPQFDLMAFFYGASKYECHTWVRKAVKLTADNISPLTVRVMSGTGKNAQPVETHPFALRLESPNPSQSGADLWNAWVINLMLGGDVGAEVVYPKNSGRTVSELWMRNSNEFSVIPGSGGVTYLDVAGYKIDTGMGDSYTLKPNEFIQWRFYNPLNPYRGLSPITAARRSISIDEFAQRWSENFFRNGARPDYVAFAKEGTTKTERDEVRNSLMSDFGGVENAHGVAVLEQNIMDIKALSFPVKDIEWLNQREFSRDEVAGLFGVPDILMGYGNDSYDTEEKREAAMHAFWLMTLLPIVRMRDRGLTKFARDNGLIKPTERVETDLTSVPELADDLKAKAEIVKALTDCGVPLNVANELAGTGVPPLDGGDVGYINGSLVGVYGTPQAKNVAGNAIKYLYGLADQNTEAVEPKVEVEHD